MHAVVRGVRQLRTHTAAAAQATGCLCRAGAAEGGEVIYFLPWKCTYHIVNTCSRFDCESEESFEHAFGTFFHEVLTARLEEDGLKLIVSFIQLKLVRGRRPLAGKFGQGRRWHLPPFRPVQGAPAAAACPYCNVFIKPAAAR